jgi:membrane-bound metal-dependent hydrolase YbcI (DUF457 family)
MASYKGHLRFSSALGLAYGGLSWWQLHVDWPDAAVGGLLTALGGLLPDLDSDSGVPVRELTTLTAVAVPMVLMRRVAGIGLSPEQAVLGVVGIYVLIRYVFFALFRKVTVHRGMFHSIPAMLIAGLLTFLAFEHPSVEMRGYFAVGVMLGFLSHLVLDELCSVDLNGVVPKLNHFAGTAVKFYSPSKTATGLTYLLLAGLGFEVWREVTPEMGKSSITTHVAAGNETKPNEVVKDLSKKLVGFPERPRSTEQLRWRPAAKQRPDHVPLSIPGSSR